MTACAFIFWIAAAMADDPRDMVPSSRVLPVAHLRTRGAHEHEWIEGPRGGVYYITDRGTKVYRRRGK